MLSCFLNLDVTDSAQSVAFGFAQQDYASKTGAVHYPGVAAELRYPPTPEQQPRFVHPAQVSSPSPGISPSGDYSQLHPIDIAQGCDPRFTVGSPMNSGATSPSQRSVHTDAESGILSLSPDSQPGSRASVRRKRRRPSFTSSSGGDEDYRPGDSGESEKEDEEDAEVEADGEDDDDDDYVQGARPRNRGVRRSRRTMSSISPIPTIPAALRGSGRVHAPVPIDGLTKKSRGRRVPTVSPLTNSGGIIKVRCHHVFSISTVV